MELCLKKISRHEHVHDYDEIVIHPGTDPANQEELGGEIEFIVDGQPLIINKTSAIYVPKGIKHGLLTWKKYSKPYLEFTTMIGAGSLAQADPGGHGKRRERKIMAKYDKKYFVTELKDVVGDAPWSPVFANNEARRLLSLDADVIPGAFYMESAWFFPGDWPEKTKNDPTRTIGKHVHDFDETIAWVGTDPTDPHNLNGEIEVWIDGQQNIIDKSFIAFIPAGVEHGPINIRKITKPMFHFTAGMGKKYKA